MKKIIYNFLKIVFIIIIFIIIFIHNYPSIKYYNTPQLLNHECKIIEHSLGKSCIPLNPQRIVVTDDITLEILVALYLKPIAAPQPKYVANKASLLGEHIKNITSIGIPDNLNIEKILKLHPDFIIGLYGITSQNYRLLSQVAPTVKVDYVQSKWKQSFKSIGEILNKEKTVEQALLNYHKKINDLKLVLNSKIKKNKITVSRFHALQILEFRSQYSFPGSVLEEVGFIPLEAQQELVKTPEDTSVTINPERFDLLDTNILFMAIDYSAIKLFNKYQNSSLWQTLKVVKKQQVYQVDSSYWIFGNILSANAILDDLFKYLIKIND